MERFLPIFLIGFAVLVFLQCSSPFEPEVKEFADTENEILREVNANQIPSLAAWVVKDDSLVWQKYYGYAEVASRRAADRNTIYGLASISKLVIVTATMQLREQGLLNLDADINAYLPFAVRNPNYPEQKITPYHLLTHTSGLAWPENEFEVPEYYTHYPLDSAPPLREWLPEFILPEGAHYVSTVWKNSRPGEREGYSNIGTALLAYLVEVVSKTDYNEYCKQHIFAPLEMFNASYVYADLDRSNLATLYDYPNHPIGFYRYRDYPAGDLKSTIANFSHLVMAYMHGGQYKNARILQESTVQDILKMRNPASGICLLWDYTVGDWYGHAGGKPGVAAYVEFQRDSKVALMIASNYRHGSVYPGNKIHALVRRIAKRYE
ncbi:beta-lactamase family protein [candidate division KSB1 bacterium]|nr:beta-lactamase family protein [candidate division KSB1 bacterium]